MNSPGPLGELCLSYSRFCAHQKCEGLPHESKKDEQFREWFVPAGSMVLANIWYAKSGYRRSTLLSRDVLGE